MTRRVTGGNGTTVLATGTSRGTAVSTTAYVKPAVTRLQPGGKSNGKSAKKSSGKSSGKPEVESSGKSFLPLPQEILPLTADDDFDLEFEGDIEQESGWRLEQNSNGYYRWRWQLKNPDGSPVTYVNENGKVGYKRGSKYVGKKED